ncbi:MAG: transcription elongation factor GreA [Candidatus Subteraquimicrobiales bacterium]|nr:transcription elongation factor GreA [Candidatus Subteraquimicrobiales bacterium]
MAERIKESVASGDLFENSEYEDAKNEQAFLEGRIAYLNDLLSGARVIDEKKVKTSEVTLGSRVTLKELSTDEEVEYHLVGSVETDPENHAISNESPVGKAIFGKKVGEVVRVEVPSGVVKYEIVKIKK